MYWWFSQQSPVLWSSLASQCPACMDTWRYAISKSMSSCLRTVIFLCHHFALDLTDHISLSHDHWSVESISCYHYPCSAHPAQTVLCFSSAAPCLGSTGSPVAPNSPSLGRSSALAAPKNGWTGLPVKQVKICSSEIWDLQSAADFTAVLQM